MAKERDKDKLEEVPMGLMLPEDARDLIVEEAAKDGIIPGPGSGDDLETPGPVPSRPHHSAPPLPENLRAITPDLAPPASTAAIGNSPGRETENDITDPMVRRRSWAPLAAGASLGAVALAIGGTALSISKLQPDQHKEEPEIVQPSLSELLKNKSNTSEIVAPPTPPAEVPESEEVKELKRAFRSSHDGILVVWCGEKPGQLARREEVILYPKEEPELTWDAVQWEVPWKQIRGFDAFPAELSSYCDEANLGQRTIIVLDKPSQ